MCYVLHMFVFGHAVCSLFLELLDSVDTVIFLHLYLPRRGFLTMLPFAAGLDF